MLTGDQMRHFVSSQTYALRSYAAGRPGTDRFGFAWAPNNESGLPSARFVAETGSVLDRLGAALSESGAEWPIDPGFQACQSLGADWCVAGVPGAVFTDAWRIFSSWQIGKLPGVPDALVERVRSVVKQVTPRGSARGRRAPRR
jgi:hypothetical protein